MKWEDYPIENGFYWARANDQLTVVHVVDGEAVFPVIGNQRIKVAVHLLPFMWAGPIPEPEAAQ